MDNITPPIRNAVRALIVENGQILLLHKNGGPRGERFVLPGGAQDLGETAHQALQRECMEEIGASVTVGALVHVADFFKDRGTEPPTVRQHLELWFSCRLPAGYIPANGSSPDKHQEGVEWVSLNDLSDRCFYPPPFAPYVQSIARPGSSVFLGVFSA